MLNMLKDPAKRAEWVYGQPMAPCPKCGTMNAWEALRKKNERLRDALEAVRAWDIGRAMDDMTLIGAKVNFRIPERIRSKIQSALQGDKP